MEGGLFAASKLPEEPPPHTKILNSANPFPAL